VRRRPAVHHRPLPRRRVLRAPAPGRALRGRRELLPALGCIPSPPESCDSGDECTRGNECLGEWSCQPEFGCQFVSPPDCDDGDECTVDSCSIDDGACAHPVRDADADGYGALECGADDCNDESESINPGAAETCDFVDNDCDGNVDERSRWSRSWSSVLTFTDDGTSLVVNGSVCPMTGASARVSRTINVSCTLSGICTETYSLSGTFTTDTTWTGILTATFVGSCIDCVDQSHTRTGTTR